LITAITNGALDRLEYVQFADLHEEIGRNNSLPHRTGSINQPLGVEKVGRRTTAAAPVSTEQSGLVGDHGKMALQVRHLQPM
jgi:hypothetical protein